MPDRPTWVSVVTRIVGNFWVLAASSAVLLGVLLNSNTATNGYRAGVGDHFVLSPQGINLANPDAFKGDWFLENAPQPHWFFDLVTYVGASLNSLAAFYFLYWCVGLVAFGIATALLARYWVRTNPWIATLAMTAVASVTPWAFLGTGTGIIPFALPAVLSSHLIYLALACLLTGKRGWFAAIAVLVAVVHVQQGSVMLIVMLAVAVVDLVRERRVLLSTVAGLLGGGGAVAIGLSLRPIASNLNDFVEVCDTIIPFHCAAHTWSTTQVAACLGYIVLAALSVFFTPGRYRPYWLASVGLAALGLALGMLADHLQLPFVGQLSQATNIYRLGALLLPFMVWGLLLPVLKPARSRGYAAILTLWAVAFLAITRDGYWSFIGNIRNPVFFLAILAIVAFAVLNRRYFRTQYSKKFVVGVGAGLVSLIFLFTAAFSHALAFHPVETRFIADETLHIWGATAKQSVAPGELIVAPPAVSYIGMITERPVIATCKHVPYGGQPWDEWKSRINDLGGLEANCNVVAELAAYTTLTADELVALADKYDSDHITVAEENTALRSDLKELGWTIVVNPAGTVHQFLLERNEHQED
jgi:hypothetical protein